MSFLVVQKCDLMRRLVLEPELELALQFELALGLKLECQAWLQHELIQEPVIVFVLGPELEFVLGLEFLLGL